MFVIVLFCFFFVIGLFKLVMVMAVMFILLFSLLLRQTSETHIPMAQLLPNASGPGSEFHHLLKSRADNQSVIVLALTDSSYVEMALNLYLSSFVKLDIVNYLFVCADSTSSDYLTSLGIPNINAFNDKGGSKLSNWGSKDFKRKTHYKTSMILEGLKLGLNVLVTDLDIVFLKNPIPYLNCSSCDLQIQSDMIEGNSGFYMVRPTSAGISLHVKAMEMAEKHKELSNQKTVDRTLEKMQKEKKIKTRTLSHDLFPCGVPFFEKGKRMFADDNPCKSCVIVHNNWIVGYHAKRYRFKEMLMWYVDTGGYYSSNTRQYLQYDNPKDWGSKDSYTREKEALQNALAIAYILNRTLILPTFQCYCSELPCKKNDKKCALNSHFSIVNFDEQFNFKYREHVFLQSDLVPEEIKEGRSKSNLIESSHSNHLAKDPLQLADYHYTPGNEISGPLPHEITNWFGAEHSPVLHFHSLYGNFSGLWNADPTIAKMLNKGVKKLNYRQYT